MTTKHQMRKAYMCDAVKCFDHAIAEGVLSDDEMAEHTPGPWSRNISAKYPVYAETESADGKRDNVKIASILHGAPESEREANLNLITAAPETAAERDRLKAINTELVGVLLNAEKWLGKLIADGGHLNCTSPRHAVRTLDDVSAAIAKATP